MTTPNDPAEASAPTPSPDVQPPADVPAQPTAQPTMEPTAAPTPVPTAPEQAPSEPTPSPGGPPHTASIGRPGYPPTGYPPPGYPAGGYPAGGYGGYPPPSAYPFVPTLREPWVNPGKKRTVGLLAAVAAVLLLGIGFVAGANAADRHGDRGRAFSVPAGRAGDGAAPGLGQPGYRHLPDRGFPGQRQPGGRLRPMPGGPAPSALPGSPSSSPSASPSSSHS